MLTKLFGEVTTGRLARLPYLGYSILLNVIWILGLSAVIITIGGAELFIDGDIQQAQQVISDRLALPFIMIFIPFILLIIYGSLNVVAKRIRDMGFPGWITLIITGILVMVISFYVSEDMSNLFGIIFALLLLFVPGSRSGSSYEL